ncbi:MAG TPA: hypothetical protein VMU47_15895 [Caldimonas sp.]|nr:hypothetical protein [Caldimonas sp.]
MNDSAIHPAYELRFRSLHNAGRGYAFACDARGHVDLDALSERARSNYLYARTVVGREFETPAVQARDPS